jgi:hypothetical protein
MPPVSAKQRRLMQAVAHDPAIADKTGVSQSVAKDFVKSDPGGKLPEIKKDRRDYPKNGDK